MKPIYTVISDYSLAEGKVGQPIGNPMLVPHNEGKVALLHLWEEMEKGNGKMFTIRFTDGAEVPFDAAYKRIFGESPIYRDNKSTLYPRLSFTR